MNAADRARVVELADAAAGRARAATSPSANVVYQVEKLEQALESVAIALARTGALGADAIARRAGDAAVGEELLMERGG